MYESNSTAGGRAGHSRLLVGAALAAVLLAPAAALGQTLAPAPSLIRKISGTAEKLELTTNSSRILTLGMKIPRVQVNNPELLEVTPLSATEVQIAAKKAGVTQVNLWDDQGRVHTVDVFIYGDVRELEHALATQFPNSSIRVYRYSNALVLNGFIDRPDYVTPIVELAQDYSPKVINNISVGGVQQVLLKVRIFEVSRSKLRKAGVDFAALGKGGGVLATATGGLLSNVSNGTGALQSVVDTGGQTVQFGVTSNGNQLLGFLDALQENNLAKILAEPNITAVSGRPAQFNEGGEIPIIVPQGFGQISIEYKKFGTQVDFLPIVLGNGSIRLEVRPRVSELDVSNGITVNDIQIPALTVREVDTAVEMKAGQTFALAGLIQRRVVGINRGLPHLADLPLLGIPFRTVSEDVNEIELLIVVTPEFVDPLDPHEAPRCMPGMGTMSPNNHELYHGGRVEVHNRCNECGQTGCVRVHGHEPCCPTGCASGSCGGPIGYALPPGGAAYAPVGGHAHTPTSAGPAVGVVEAPIAPVETPAAEAEEVPVELAPRLGPASPREQLKLPPMPAEFAPNGGGSTSVRPTGRSLPVSGPLLAPRNPQYQRDASEPYQATPATPAAPALFGPVGYDDE